MGVVAPQKQEQQYPPQPKHLLQYLTPPPQLLQEQHMQQQQQYKLSYVNYESNKAPPITTKTAQYLHMDAPADIRANLIEFNAMAQMHNTAQDHLSQSASAATAVTVAFNKDALRVLKSANHTMQNKQQNNELPPIHTRIRLNKIVAVPTSRVESSVQLQ